MKKQTRTLLLVLLLVLAAAAVYFGLRAFFAAQDAGQTGPDGGAESASASGGEEGVGQSGSASASAPEPAPLTEEEKLALRARELLSGMTLEEKAWQTLIVYPESINGGTVMVSAGDATREALERCPVGGFLLDKKNMESREQVTEMLTAVQTFGKIPLLLTCDEEGGRVSRLMDTVGTTKFGPMLSYQDQGPETARANAATIAGDLVSCGFNMDLAPVADVWSNPQNTVIGDRAYSDDFGQAAELVAAAVRGFHDGGAAATLKHFPGHGNTSADSHYGSVYVERTLEELRAEELVPFQAGIDAGADAVMAGHLIVSDLDSEPAPFSHRIITELLREEMGFNGVVMTDGLNMQAMTDHYSSAEIAVKAVQAGVDMLLAPMDPQETAQALVDAVGSGQIPEQRLDESVLRILTLKLRYGILPPEI